MQNLTSEIPLIDFELSGNYFLSMSVDYCVAVIFGPVLAKGRMIIGL